MLLKLIFKITYCQIMKEKSVAMIFSLIQQEHTVCIFETVDLIFIPNSHRNKNDEVKQFNTCLNPSKKKKKQKSILNFIACLF